MKIYVVQRKNELIKIIMANSTKNSKNKINTFQFITCNEIESQLMYL